MGIITYLLVSLCIYVFLELVDFNIKFLEKLGIKQFFIRTLVGASVAFILITIDSVLHHIK